MPIGNLMKQVIRKQIPQSLIPAPVIIKIEEIRTKLDELIERLSLYRDSLEIYLENYGLS